jgi:hypothetical protein
MKRLNPETGQKFKRGDRREDGFIFSNYEMTCVDKSGRFYEHWLSPEKFYKRVKDTKDRRSIIENTKRGHLVVFLRSTKYRAKNKNLPFDLDMDHLLSIATDECPIFKTNFSWGINGKGLQPTSPSMDRVIPHLGYVQGNVVFISNLANTIKQNVTEKELYAVADWLHDKRKEVLNAFKNKPAPVPKPPDTPGRKDPAHGSVHGAGVGKDCDGSQHHQAELFGADPNHCA